MTRLADGRDGRDHVSERRSYCSVSQRVLCPVFFIHLKSVYLVCWHRLIRGGDRQGGDSGLKRGCASLGWRRPCPI